ncbi:hypothetical protein DUI87_14915 [Hirundo rustica rustica]|uniref:Uncharacterized protein n=1 Tax=Hirundo rustica rustica TaxID=333673 RepID=A0A3M0KN95_HIRRU|nr:hypothetical protein DUI87_14915 [Hirundo rustica rustica]
MTNCMRFNKAKCQVQPLGHNSPCSGPEWGRVAGKLPGEKCPGSAGRQGLKRVIFNVVNFSKTKSLYRDGMAPMVKSTSRPKWLDMATAESSAAERAVQVDEGEQCRWVQMSSAGAHPWVQESSADGPPYKRLNLVNLSDFQMYLASLEEKSDSEGEGISRH